MTPAIGIIPVRYRAERFPGKPLASILGKPMVQHVYENASQSRFLAKLVVATDDERILQVAESFGAEACMTSSGHASGTERVAEVAAQHDFPIVINIQGDEPLLRGESIDELIEVLQQEAVSMASLSQHRSDLTRMQDPNVVKVVMDAAGYALYFSRSPIPYNAAQGFLGTHRYLWIPEGFSFEVPGPSRLPA